ncbi:MAG: periplasmic heavy metal sensor [Oligoflexia bacterium]|nr:periplasmic heavy metal sensor [Oligoflexia bacterium]
MRGLLVALIILISTAAHAQDWGHRPHRFDRSDHPNFKEMREHHQDFMRELDLTDQQRDQLKELRGEKGAMRDRMEELRNKREDLQGALRDKQVSDDEVRRRAKELSDRQHQLMDQRIENLIKLRKVLTPDQMEKILERIDERRQEFGKHRRPPGEPQEEGDRREFDDNYRLP